MTEGDDETRIMIRVIEKDHTNNTNIKYVHIGVVCGEECERVHCL